jgi:hypothetical protein
MPHDEYNRNYAKNVRCKKHQSVVDDFFLPDFCNMKAVLKRINCGTELLAVFLTLADLEV